MARLCGVCIASSNSDVSVFKHSEVVLVRTSAKSFACHKNTLSGFESDQRADGPRSGFIASGKVTQMFLLSAFTRFDCDRYANNGYSTGQARVRRGPARQAGN